MSAIAVDRLASIDPATGEVVGDVPVTAPDAIGGVVARARAAAIDWARRSPAQRAALIEPLGDAIRERADELARLLTREMGKPLRESLAEVRACAPGDLDEIVAALEPEVLEDERATSTMYRDPHGVCAAITPWNFPMKMPASLVIPALVAGNTVILKPSEETPLTAQAYVDLLAPLLPDGVLQIVHGADDQGKALVSSDVDLIAFTGSREVGQSILSSASGDLKRVILELGGKDPLVVLADADIDRAAEFAVNNSFRNAGQVCVSTERIYVDERIADAFESAVVDKARAQRQGAGVDEGVTVGPMINARQRDHVVRQIEAAVSDGATALTGGEPDGNFIPPTVLANVTHDMDVMREETFGPVACIMRFSDDDEAVRLANDTPFGLGASVFGESTHASAVGRRLGAGMIGVNQGCYGAKGSPWVGARHSGFGYHSGRDGHRQFAQVRVVSTPK